MSIGIAFRARRKKWCFTVPGRKKGGSLSGLHWPFDLADHCPFVIWVSSSQVFYSGENPAKLVTG